MRIQDLLISSKSEKKLVLCAVLGAMSMVTTGFTRSAIPTDLHKVSIHVDGRTITTNTTHTSPDYILARAGVKLGAHDEYHLQKLNERHTDITVYRAVPITVEYQGEKKEIMTSKKTVGDALNESGYYLESIDVQPGLDAEVKPGLSISVKDKAVVQQEEQLGAAGGTISTAGSGSAADTGRYQAAYTMEATAYLPSDGGGSGITASGMVARRGVVAVDPNVIPLGTRLYIPGYGEAIAADTGGAIRGDRIDLCMESYGEAMQFGRRYVTVYVIC